MVSERLAGERVPLSHRLPVLLAALLAASSVAPTPASGAQEVRKPRRAQGTTAGMPRTAPFDFRGDLRKLPPAPPEKPRPTRKPLRLPNVKEPPPAAKPPVPNVTLGTMPAPTTSFAGMYKNFHGSGWPPDTNGEIGLAHYIQAVNSAFTVYDRTGAEQAVFTENQLWVGTPPTPCNGQAQGDPIVIYDPTGDRWILTNFAFPVDGSNNPIAPFYECVAVSKTSDPVAGGWWLYALRMDPGTSGAPPVGTLNDYPKFGFWPGCLTYSANGFDMTAPTQPFSGVVYGSMNLVDLENGAFLNWSLGFTANATEPFSLVPASVRGNTPDSLPAPGSATYFVSESQTAYAFEVRTFTPSPGCGAGGALSLPTNVTHDGYARTWSVSPFETALVPQPDVTQKLDMIDDRVMQKVQYRKVGAVESLWVVHTTETAGYVIQPQWAQLDVTGGTIATVPVQQQIFAPDATLHRWMGSIAADSAGNAAVGYSISGDAAPAYPGIAYAGRLAGDPAGNLSQAEVPLVAGTGSQTTYDRWGDYSAMSVDPLDDCTFWYTNEYYAATGTNWQTRVGAFSFPQPSACTPTPVSSTYHTVTFDGGVGSDWKASTERLGTASGFAYYTTWDATSLTVGFKGDAQGDLTYVAVVNTDPGGAPDGGSAGALACAGGFNPAAPGDFALVRTGDTLSTPGSTTAHQGSGGTWSTWAPSAGTGAADRGRNMAELRFAWADLGLASPATPVGITLYVCDGASLVSAWPSLNPQSGNPTLLVELVFPTHDAGRVPNTYGTSLPVGLLGFSVE